MDGRFFEVLKPHSTGPAQTRTWNDQSGAEVGRRKGGRGIRRMYLRTCEPASARRDAARRAGGRDSPQRGSWTFASQSIQIVQTGEASHREIGINCAL